MVRRSAFIHSSVFWRFLFFLVVIFEIIDTVLLHIARRLRMRLWNVHESGAVTDRKRSWIRANKPSASWPSFSLISERALLSSGQLFYQWFDTPQRKILHPRVYVNIDHPLLLATEYSISSGILPISWSGAYASSSDNNIETSVTS